MKFLNDHRLQTSNQEEIDHIALKTLITGDPDAPLLKDVINGPDKHLWMESMALENQNMIANKVLELVPFTGQRCLPVKPIFKIKRNEKGELKSRKTRYVVQGFRQIEGVDYNETFSPVVQYHTILIILHHASQNKMLIDQVDFDAAFLNAPLIEEIFIENLPGLEKPPNGFV